MHCNFLDKKSVFTQGFLILWVKFENTFKIHIIFYVSIFLKPFYTISRIFEYKTTTAIRSDITVFTKKPRQGWPKIRPWKFLNWWFMSSEFILSIKCKELGRFIRVLSATPIWCSANKGTPHKHLTAAEPLPVPQYSAI